MGNRAVEMMVDTGAQTSVISMPLVRTLGLESMLDSRYQGQAGEGLQLSRWLNGMGQEWLLVLVRLEFLASYEVCQCHGGIDGWF